MQYKQKENAAKSRKKPKCDQNRQSKNPTKNNQKIIPKKKRNN